MDRIIIYLTAINILGAVLDGATAARRRRVSRAWLSVLLGIIAAAGGAPGMIIAFALCDRTATKANMMLRVFTVCVCIVELAVALTIKLAPTGDHGTWSFAFWGAFTEHRWFMYYIAAVSIVTFIMFGFDKYRAIKGGWRIPIAALLGMAFAGGSVGALLGMVAFRHKIRKNYFYVGVPMIIVMQMVLMMCAVNLWG